MKIQVDSGSPVSFLKNNIIHELKQRDPYLKILPVDQATKDVCSFTDGAIKIIGKIDLLINSNGWNYEYAPFLITGEHERNI